MEEKTKEDVCQDTCCSKECDCSFNDKGDSKCDCEEKNCSCECQSDNLQSDKDKHQMEDDKKHKSHKRIKELEEKVKILEDQILREKAESINFKKRKEEETNRILKFCHEDLVKDILPTIDSLERAIKMDDDNLEDEVSKFLAGVKMIYCNQVNILEKYGVKAIDGANKPFDPTYHQAVMTEHRDGVEPGMVLEVLQKGYLLKDRVIRPAMVKVSE